MTHVHPRAHKLGLTRMGRFLWVFRAPPYIERQVIIRAQGDPDGPHDILWGVRMATKRIGSAYVIRGSLLDAAALAADIATKPRRS